MKVICNIFYNFWGMSKFFASTSAEWTLMELESTLYGTNYIHSLLVRENEVLWLQPCIQIKEICLFSFYGRSTIVRYLMPNPFLYK